MSSDRATIYDHINDFREAMRAAGVPFSGEIDADGKIHRFYVEGDARGTLNGWYLMHDDTPVSGSFGTMRGTQQKHTWTASRGSAPLTAEEREAAAAKRAADKARKAAEEVARQELAAERAAAMWEAATPATEHAYLTRKGVASQGLRVGDWVKERKDGSTYVAAKGALLIPIRDERKKVWGLQAIFEKPITMSEALRDKDFVYGARKAGCWYSFGAPTEIDGKKTIAICEGYATGESVHQATGLGIVVAFDAGNLRPVAEAVRRLMPSIQIVILADDDRFTESGNTGLVKARDAAEAVGGICLAPKFASDDGKPTDWNDLHALEGLDVVKRQVMHALCPPDPAASEDPPTDDPAPWDGPGQFEQTDYVDPDEDREIAQDIGPDDKDTDGNFRVLGFDRDLMYIYQYKLKMIVARKRSDWPENALLDLAKLQWWEREFPAKSGFDKRAATNWLMRAAEAKGYFDPSCRRGRGAWMDAGRIVYHFGNRLMIDGVMQTDLKINSNYVYEQARPLRPPADTPMSSADGRKILELTRQFAWSRPSSAILWAGWCALAPLGGALGWRPHVWVTGGAGSGKTTILSVAHWLLNGGDINAQGNSTEAGIRQTLKIDGIPVIFDESEQNNDREAMRIQAVLGMMRQSSSESDAKTYKGSAGGDAMDFHIRSMFHLSSIQVGMKQQADFERVSVLSLRAKREVINGKTASESWIELKNAIDALKADTDLPARLLRRSLTLLPITLQNIEIFSQAAAERFGTQRDGDQYGTMLAGAWSLISTRLATLQDAREMIARYDWSDYLEGSESEESTKALGALLESKIRAKSGVDVSVYELVAAAAGRQLESCRIDAEDADAFLRRNGMAVKWDSKPHTPERAIFLVSYNSLELQKLMRDTPYAADLKGQLQRLPGASKRGKMESFSGRKDRSTAIPMTQILDDLREPEPGEDIDAFDDTIEF